MVNQAPWSALQMAYKVFVLWDADANVWVAHSDDIPGLNTEDASRDRLVSRVMDVAPELLALNGARRDTNEVVFLFEERREHLPAAA